jgi:uncharacterized protein (DUF952 family)
MVNAMPRLLWWTILLADRAPCLKHRLTGARRRGITPVMLIYKIFRAPEWEALRAAGETQGAPVDLADGFVHFSTAAQAAETAAKHFAGEDGLMLLAVETDRLGEALKWEVSRGGALFPHLYRALRMQDVVWARPLPLENGAHRFPEGLA